MFREDCEETQIGSNDPYFAAITPNLYPPPAPPMILGSTIFGPFANAQNCIAADVGGTCAFPDYTSDIVTSIRLLTLDSAHTKLALISPDCDADLWNCPDEKLLVLTSNTGTTMNEIAIDKATWLATLNGVPNYMAVIGAQVTGFPYGVVQSGSNRAAYPSPIGCNADVPGTWYDVCSLQLYFPALGGWRSNGFHWTGLPIVAAPPSPPVDTSLITATGGCVVNENCVCTSNLPGSECNAQYGENAQHWYTHNQHCEIDFGQSVMLEVYLYRLKYGDPVVVNGVTYRSEWPDYLPSAGPDGVVTSSMTWSSDGSGNMEGFKICAVPPPPGTPPAPPPPTFQAAATGYNCQSHGPFSVLLSPDGNTNTASYCGPAWNQCTYEEGVIGCGENCKNNPDCAAFTIATYHTNPDIPCCAGHCVLLSYSGGTGDLAADAATYCPASPSHSVMKLTPDPDYCYQAPYWITNCETEYWQYPDQTILAGEADPRRLLKGEPLWTWAECQELTSQVNTHYQNTFGEANKFTAIIGHDYAVDNSARSWCWRGSSQDTSDDNSAQSDFKMVFSSDGQGQWLNSVETFDYTDTPYYQNCLDNMAEAHFTCSPDTPRVWCKSPGITTFTFTSATTPGWTTGGDTRCQWNMPNSHTEYDGCNILVSTGAHPFVWHDLSVHSWPNNDPNRDDIIAGETPTAGTGPTRYSEGRPGGSGAAVEITGLHTLVSRYRRALSRLTPFSLLRMMAPFALV